MKTLVRYLACIAFCWRGATSRWVALGIVSFSMVSAHAQAQAQAQIVIGQSCDMSGVTAPRVKEYARGADAFILSINEAGGVNGHALKLIRYDDGFKPAKTLENAKRLVEQDGAMILFGMGSAPGTAAVLPYAKEKGVPILGSLSGADSLRQGHRLLFHVRASFGDEIERIALHLSTVGLKRVAVMAADLPIGVEGAATMERIAKQRGLDLVRVVRVDEKLKNLADAAAAIAHDAPQAVLILAPAGPGIKFTQALKEAKVGAQLVGLSVMSSDSLYKALGDKSVGMIITQIVPFPWGTRLAITRDYQNLMARTHTPLSIDTMEGYVSARLLVEALRGAGSSPSRESFVAALERMNDKDMGGIRVTLSAKDRVAMSIVDITMIGAGGKLLN